MSRAQLQPFRFKTVLSLVEMTGKQASSLDELCRLLEKCDEACIFYHTFRAYGSHHYMRGHYNDIAQWVHTGLGLEAFSEEIAGIDVRDYDSIDQLGKAIVGTIRRGIAGQPEIALRRARQPFYLSKVISLAMPVSYCAASLEEFVDALSKVSHQSIYYHYVEARLRVGLRSNDFSIWVAEQLEMPELAARINGYDLALVTMEDVRGGIIKMGTDILLSTDGRQRQGP